MRHKVRVDNHTFALMIDEVLRHYIDHSGVIIAPNDEILFISEHGVREALYTVMYTDQEANALICSIRLEKWAKGNVIPDSERANRVPEKNFGICI
jgi:hypothetical protein